MSICLSREYKRGKYHCTVDPLFDWFGLVCFANKNKNCQLSYSWFQTSQTGGQPYSDTSPFSIPWSVRPSLSLSLSLSLQSILTAGHSLLCLSVWSAGCKVLQLFMNKKTNLMLDSNPSRLHVLPLDRGARKLTGENLKVVWAEFSTIS